jgi:hypothetical protein
MKRRTEITIETERIVIASRNTASRPPLIWCLSCAEQVVPLTIDEAAIEWRVSSLTLFRRSESGLVHYVETADGLLLICPYSLRPPAASRLQLSAGLQPAFGET